MKILLPANLDLYAITAANPPFEVDHFKIEMLALLLSQIDRVKSTQRKRIYPEGFVALQAKRLQWIVRNYRQYLDYAKRVEILEEKPDFEVHIRCRRFRYKSQYQVKIIPFQNPETERPVDIAKANQGVIDLPRKYKIFKRPFLKHNLEFDELGARELVDLMYEYNIKHPDQMAINERTGRRKEPLDQYNSALFVIERFVSGDFFMNVDKNGGRLHTSFTTMPSYLRNFVTVDENYLGSLDIVNCMPTLFNLYLTPEFYVNYSQNQDFSGFMSDSTTSLSHLTFANTELLNFDLILSKDRRERGKEREKGRKGIGKEEERETLITLVNAAQVHECQDLQRFREWTLSGRLYENLCERLSKEVDPKFADRNYVKKEFMRIMFSSNKFYNQKEAEAKRWFCNNFPNVYEILAAYKVNGKSYLPCLLWATESEIVLNKIARKIMAEHRNMPVLTIHDCILTTPPYLDALTAFISSEFEKCTGMAVKLKEEFYGPENEKLARIKAKLKCS